MTSTNEIQKSESGAGVILKTDTRGRVRVSRERREEMLREYERSGMSAAEFAKWSGMKYTTLCGWLQRHRRAVSAAKPGREMKWLEAVVAEPKAGVGHGMVIHLGGGIRIEALDGKTAVEILKGLGVKACWVLLAA